MNVSSCNQYDGYTRAEGDTTQQSNIMIWYDWYRGHDVWTLGSARKRCNWRHGRSFYLEVREGERCYTIKNRYNGQCRSLRHQQDNASGRHG